jgi:MraZ protein
VAESVDKWRDVGEDVAHDDDSTRQVGARWVRAGQEWRGVFLGENRHSVDGKGRIVLPSRYRPQLLDGCVVTKGRDGQLMIYPPDVYEARAQEVMARRQDQAGRRLSRTFFAGADELELDKAGRLLLRQELRDFAGLEISGEAVVIGVFDHIEVWNTATYEAQLQLAEEEYTADDEEDDPTY